MQAAHRPAGHRPAADLVSFIREAGRRGRYNTSQQRLFGTAIALAIAHAEDKRTLTVDGLKQRIDEVPNPFSFEDLAAGTLGSYRSRAKRVLRDFYRWSDDFDSWEATEAARDKRVQTSLPSARLWRLESITTTPLRLPSGAIAELIAPLELGVPDMEALSTLLKSLARHYDLQIETIKGANNENQ